MAIESKRYPIPDRIQTPPYQHRIEGSNLWSIHFRPALSALRDDGAIHGQMSK